MPIETNSSASAPFSTSSLPTWGPRIRRGAPPRVASPFLSSAVTVSDSWALLMPCLIGRRIKTSRAVPKFCTAASTRPRWPMASRILLTIGGLRIGHFHHRAAGEIDTEVEAPGAQRTHRDQERDDRYHVEDQRIAHERDIAFYSEEFHVRFRESSIVNGEWCESGFRFTGFDLPFTLFPRPDVHTWPIETLSSRRRLP